MIPNWINNPGFIKIFYPGDLVWTIRDDTQPSVYLTFDDGPHPTATNFVLEQLAKYNAKATFFCVGDNVSKYPEIYASVLAQGHATGNHTYNHLNGWMTDDKTYLKNCCMAAELIQSKLFRPPYGMIRFSQVGKLKRKYPGIRIVMWSLLSGDFDNRITPEQCLETVVNNIKPGAVIVFHDSTKAWDRMHIVLPQVLKFCKEQNWAMKSIS